MTAAALKDFLDEKADFYNHPAFIDNDPIQIPHRFSEKQDREIAGFLTATISWGNRKSILASADKMMKLMDHAPYDFIRNFESSDLHAIRGTVVHRTFNGDDLAFFLTRLQHIYSHYNSLEDLFVVNEDEDDFYHSLARFRSRFLGDQPHRAHKHVSSTYKNSSAKRLMMFLRWMVRQDRSAVDFGIWKRLTMSKLSIPLDVHSGNVARQLYLLTRRQNDWKAVHELDKAVRQLDAADPAKYDFALFGLGVSGELNI